MAVEGDKISPTLPCTSNWEGVCSCSTHTRIFNTFIRTQIAQIYKVNSKVSNSLFFFYIVSRDPLSFFSIGRDSSSSESERSERWCKVTASAPSISSSLTSGTAFPGLMNIWYAFAASSACFTTWVCTTTTAAERLLCQPYFRAGLPALQEESQERHAKVFILCLLFCLFCCHTSAQTSVDQNVFTVQSSREFWTVLNFS